MLFVPLSTTFHYELNGRSDMIGKLLVNLLLTLPDPNFTMVDNTDCALTEA